jgi:hypothetical protein
VIYQSGIFREKIIRRFTSSDLGFRYLSSECKDQSDFQILKRLPNSSVDLAPLSESFYCHNADQTKIIFSLQNAIVEPISSYVFDGSRRLIGDSLSFSIEHAIRRWTIRPRSRIPDVRIGTYLLIGSSAYYHWLIEDLPSYLHARALRPDLVTLVYSRSPRYVFEFLQMLNIDFETFERNIQIDELIFSSKGAALQAHSVDVDVLLSLSNSLSFQDKKNVHKKIYISRLQQGRCPINEIEVQQVFQEHDYLIVDFASMSLQSQIDLCKQASAIAGTLGAGLANMIWCPEGISMIEISNNSQPECFRHLAKLKHLDYRAISSDSLNWTVNLNVVRENLMR